MQDKEYLFACVKSTSYQDLWVSNICNNAFNIFKSSMMRCPPIGLTEQFKTEFIILKESFEEPCQVIRSCIPEQFKKNLLYSATLKNPSLRCKGNNAAAIS